MSFSNVNIGNRAGDHAGDPLRTAFNKINQNFYKISTGEVDITVNAPVTAVAGRTGNIVLTVDDITGAVSSGELDSLVDAAITGSNISLFTNDSSYATTTYVDTKFASTSGASQVYVDSQDAAVTAAWTANAAVQAELINTINANITAANAAIVTANTALKSYTDDQISTAINNLINSAPGTLDTLGEIAANLASEAGAIGGILTSMTNTNANVTAANAAIVTANTAMKAYVDAQDGAITTAWTANAAAQLEQIIGANTSISNLQANAAAQQTSINSINANLGGFYTYANATFGTSSYANSNVAAYLTTQGISAQLQSDWNQATTGNVTYIKNKPDLTVYSTVANAAIQATWLANLEANAATQATSINTLNANVGSYYTWANANVAGLYNSILGANATISTLQANIDSYYTWANANVAGLYNSILGANANAASQQTSINNINANIGGFYTYANTTFGTSSYANANVASYLPTYSGNVQALTVVGNLIAGTTPGTNYHNIRGNLVLGTANSVSAAGDSVLTILGYGVTDTPILGRAGVHYSAGVNYNATFLADSYGTGVSSFFGRHARGTNATPTAVQSGDTIGAIYFRGYGATGYTATGDAPGMYIVATENFTDSAQGTALILEATPVGAISSVPYVKLDSSGNVVVTTTTDSTSATTGALTVKGGIGVSGSIYTAGNITTLANVISPNFLFPNGVNILSTVTGGSGTYSNTNVAAYLSTDPTITTLQANIGSFYTYANATYNSGTTYSNSNVTAYLTTSNNIVIGNAVPVLYTSNAPTLQVGSVSSLRTDPLSTATSLSYNINYNSAGSPIAYRTGGVSQITLQGGVIYFNLLASTTANGSATMSQYGSISTTALTSYVPLALNASGGVTTNQSTFPLVNTTATTVNFAGAATTVNIGAANGNVNVAGSVVATGNVWAQGGYFRTSAGTAYIVNTTPTTVYLAGGATIGTYIGNASGITQLYGNVQGSTNGFAIGYRDIPQVSFTGNTTIALSDAGKHYYSTSATNYILTVANNASVAFSTGAAINIINQGTGTITIAPGVGVTMYMAGNSTASTRTLASYGMATMQKVATDTWFVSGVGLA